MAQFIALDKNVEVNGQTVLSVVNAMEFGKESRAEILKELGIEPTQDSWHNQQKWLDAFKVIADKIGDKTLFMIGKAIPEHAKFPPEIDSLEKALGAIDKAYHMNHRGGEIGHYKLVAYDGEKKEAVMSCNNPYPSEFDRGIITTMLRKFKPKNSFNYSCELDINKESRQDGKKTCTYLINW